MGNGPICAKILFSDTNNIGPNIGVGLNFVTYEQTLIGKLLTTYWSHRQHAIIVQPKQNETNKCYTKLP